MHKLHKIIVKIKRKIVQSIVNRNFPCYYKHKEKDMNVAFWEDNKMELLKDNNTHSASEIAKWFLSRNNEDYKLGNTDELISNLKLQKLLYYAQGCVLAITDKPLFNDNIVAWEHGPVVPSVYHEYKNNGKSGIEFNENYDRSSIGQQLNDILESVYAEFGQYSARKLRNMTHEETPYIKTCKNDVIDNNLIKSYFKENYVE